MNNKVYPTIKNAISISLIFILLGIIGGVIIGIFTVILDFFPGGQSQLITDILLTAATIIEFVFIFRYFSKRSGLKINTFFRITDINRFITTSFLFLMIGVVIISSEIDNLLKYFLPEPSFIQEIFNKMSLNNSFIISILLLVIIPAVFEEILFRGFILNGLKKNYSIRKSIIISSLLFAFVHLNPWQFFPAVLLGVIFGWVTIKTNSIVLPIIGHLLNNSLYLLAVRFPDFISFTGFKINDKDSVFFQPLLLDIAGLILMAGGIYFLWKYLKKQKKMLDLDTMQECI